MAAILAAVAANISRAGDAPGFVEHPQSIMVSVGKTLRLSCLATGTPPIAYIWQKGATFLGTQTNALLVITNAQPADAGRYAAIASNEDGLGRSHTAEVVVYPDQPCNFPWIWEARLRRPSLDRPGYGTAVNGMGIDAAGNIFVAGPAYSSEEPSLVRH